MPVYVDAVNLPYGRMTMNHLTADTNAELLAMVDKIGVQRKWIQHEGTAYEHFDICLSKKTKAIKFGAIEIGSRETADLIDRKLKAGLPHKRELKIK